MKRILVTGGLGFIGSHTVVELQNSGFDVVIIDELPPQFQKRNFRIFQKLKSQEKKSISYNLVPLQRGEYHFGALQLFVSSKLGIAMRRFSFEAEQMVKTYPAFLQLKKFELISFNSSNLEFGIKKIRKIGNSFEFEQIKDYIQGDNIKNINWKATAKRNQLMVNQFQDEKSQQVYSIIDKGRVMKMPFDGLTLLDYAINSTLAFSNIALKKKDKVGMITFAEEIKTHLPASSKKTHLQTLLESLK